MSDASRLVAAVDIGTVTTRLLIAEITPAGPVEVVRWTDITHLGEDLTVTGRLSDAAMRRVEDVIARYAEELASRGVERVRTVATSASRDASNAAVFVEMLRRYGLTPEVVSGDTEARLAFVGATWDRDGEDILVNDIGGGSTEVVVGAAAGSAGAGGPRIDFARSFDVGSRRVTEMFLRSDPPANVELEAAVSWVRHAFAPVAEELPRPARLSIALAGTATTLSAIDQGLAVYDPALVHGSRLGLRRIRELTAMLASLPLERRCVEVVGLDPGRAPVIVAGGLILGELLETAGLDSTLVSEHDILYGMVLGLAAELAGSPEAE